MRQLVVVAAVLVACKSEPSPATVVIAPAPPSASAAETASGSLLAAPAPPSGADDACRADSDCTWGEIPHDIHASAECMCLLGCPYLAQNKTVEVRRTRQYDALCKPGMDGKGHGCPIDDCAPPPPIRCVAGKCTGKR